MVVDIDAQDRICLVRREMAGRPNLLDDVFLCVVRHPQLKSSLCGGSAEHVREISDLCRANIGEDLIKRLDSNRSEECIRRIVVITILPVRII